MWWVIGAGRSAEDANVEWETQVDLTDCDEDDPCTCLSFEAFELNSKGNLLEAARLVVMKSTATRDLQNTGSKFNYFTLIGFVGGHPVVSFKCGQAVHSWCPLQQIQRRVGSQRCN